ncbi:LLM class F420-dependent oxidoreductase [Vineibacter terrae]|uniref:LLM class F420-dependent oxidoreductase n=1 Tax=Vineibacter terrae TaxID=2586908 RepID=A0A5C8PFZ3_9HYPH|nr:LLM class F420-dependent oxidoreductase [Vineibacter terrae]TXL72698.1 LLM class F420-dependent oxidoreductase [Vineibacter terrae]
MQLGASMPVSDIGTGPNVLRDYAQAVEGLGYDYLLAADHVLGKNPVATLRHGASTGVSIEHARRIGTTALAFHDPLVLFGFLSGCTTKIGFASGVLILAQRQAAIVAKQAASLDELCGGRFRLGIGVGWNEIEFQGLGTDFRTRGRRSEEQVRFMQALWAEPHTTFHGEFHHLDDGGLTLRPKSGRVPVWFGGHAEATFHRVAKYGDGYMPLNYAPGDQALAAFEKLRTLIREAGRRPQDVGLEVWVSPGAGSEDDWRREITFWSTAGVTHVTAHTTYVSDHHRRVSGRTAAEHLAALTRYRAAVADLL